jgi:hypothetical protein
MTPLPSLVSYWKIHLSRILGTNRRGVKRMNAVPLLRALWIQPGLQHFEDLGTPIGLCMQTSAATDYLTGCEPPCPARFVG